LSTFLIGANIFYLLAVWALYTYMKFRPSPFNCKWPLLVHNLGSMGFACYVSIGIIHVLTSGNLLFMCNGPGANISTGTGNVLLGHLYTVFYLQKFVEFFDTWFFILRKSFRELTIVHVYHHCSINVIVWLGLVHGIGDMYLPVLLNSIVHVLLYGDYSASCLGISTPWKPFLTAIQLSQFVLIGCFAVGSLTCDRELDVPVWAQALVIGYMVSMVLLFGHLFVCTYITKTRTDNHQTNTHVDNSEGKGAVANSSGILSGYTTDKKMLELPLASLPWLLEALLAYWYLVYAAFRHSVSILAYGTVDAAGIRRDMHVLMAQYVLETALAGAAGRCVLLYGRRTWPARAIYEHHLVSAAMLLSGDIYTSFFDPALRLMTLYGGLFTSFMTMNINEALMVLQALGLDHPVRGWLRLPKSHFPIETIRIWCVQPAFAYAIVWELYLAYKLVAGWVNGSDAEAAMWLPVLVACFLAHVYTWRFNIHKARRLLREGWHKTKGE